VGLFAEVSVAIDGSKFKAVNNRDRNFTRAKMERRMAQIERRALLAICASSTAPIGMSRSLARTTTTTRLKEKVAKLKEVMLAKPFPLELSMNHLELTEFEFAVSSTEEVLTTELTRTPMTTRSVCEAVGADADAVFREIAAISQQARKLRRKVAKAAKAVPKPGKSPK
jgi:hypothetical protein